MSGTVHIYNAIGGEFDQKKATNSGPASRWEYQFDQEAKKVTLTVYSNSIDAVISGSCTNVLSCSLGKGDVLQLIQWLYRVNAIIEE